MKAIVITTLLLGSLAVSPLESVAGAEPGWSLRVIATGEFRQQIQSTPIEKRPYRPLHFYGNSVRRRHYRGTALPMPRGLVNLGFVRR